MRKTALVSGANGQDGSYLCELLLSKGYIVHGVIRRSSDFNTGRIDHIFSPESRSFIHFGDLTTGLDGLLYKIKPDEVYNLGSMSHVKVSFDQPIYTGDATGLAVCRILEAIKMGVQHGWLKKDIKFYQASSSEMFGQTPTPSTGYNEQSIFTPVSPYGCAKLYGYHITRTYRTGYNLFASNGILFNHESILKHSPVVLRFGEEIDVVPIEDLFRSESHKYEGLLEKYEGCEVWNGDAWTKVIKGTAYRDPSKEVRYVQTREACYEATLDHHVFLHDNTEIATGDVKIGCKLFDIAKPQLNNQLDSDTKLAKFLGYVVGDGHITEAGRITLTGTDLDQLYAIADLVIKSYGFTVSTYAVDRRESSFSTPESETVFQVRINVPGEFGIWLRGLIYTEKSQEKRVPKYVLNSCRAVKEAFFEGYYLADGRKASNEVYQWKGFTTSSATLCLSLILIVNDLTKQVAKCKCEIRNDNRYYTVQFRSPGEQVKGKHLLRDLTEVIDVGKCKSEDGWFYDLQTESQTFATGANLVKIHNSPRRGPTFVTRKITRAAARIKLGLQQELVLGNLDAKRDWGHSKDYMKAIHLILQQPEPSDYVVATGEQYTVKDFVIAVFNRLNLDWEKYVKYDKDLLRPNEVPDLLGDSSKIRALGWKPEYTFKMLVDEMVDVDLLRERHQQTKGDYATK